MYWELWSVETANMIYASEVEADVLILVRELLAKGWSAENLALIFDDERLPDDALPPAVSGPELAYRAEEAALRLRTA